MSLRWSWSLFSVLLTLVSSAVIALSMITVERDALRAGQENQLRLTASILSEALSMPMMADSRAEVDRLLEKFIETSPGAMIYLRWANGESETFGEGRIPSDVTSSLHVKGASVERQERWYAQGIDFNNSNLGTIALHLPAPEDDIYSGEMKLFLAMLALLLAMLAGALAYRFSAAITQLMHRLSAASRKVGTGDFSVHIPGYGSGEMGKSVGDFNQMVSQLSSRQMTLGLFGRYQNPQQVSDSFDRTLVNSDQPARTVAVMAVEMVDFGAYSSSIRESGGLSGLNRFFSVLDNIVSANGGHVDSISGSRMVAVFNHPLNLKNYQERAAMASLEIIEASKNLSLQQSDGTAVAFNVGLAQGEVLTGYLGSGKHREFRAVGAPVSLAEHLALLGSGDEIIAGGEILHQLGYGFEQSSLGTQTLAGGESLQVANITPNTERLIEAVQQGVSAAISNMEPDGLAAPSI
ncbi:Adenylate cyclase, class 3 [Mariprofundus aestuarium]|uniref:Adenylate cyclase, class 3 n=1 Tax=Mariprofundus aestuarium TaxID=1921086 RepID=A0A2K8KYL2_MARES|nr:adenylate/guanylate cyclase domain-containing protein [Mariprofundus aestuarium]ATX78591.1 Adenylate cyclase, class 3 [Mariprofundus aestuarium]